MQILAVVVRKQVKASMSILEELALLFHDNLSVFFLLFDLPERFDGVPSVLRGHFVCKVLLCISGWDVLAGGELLIDGLQFRPAN